MSKNQIYINGEKITDPVKIVEIEEQISDTIREALKPLENLDSTLNQVVDSVEQVSTSLNEVKNSLSKLGV